MRIALHPYIEEPITIDQYRTEFGHRPLLEDDARERARCPFCPQLLNDVAGRTNSTIGHFAHFPGSAACPSKEPAGRPYLRLTPVAPDLDWAQKLKAAFLRDWDRYYIKLQDLVPLLSLEEFFGLVTEANQLRIWECRHLEPWEIPYIFVLMVDFPVSRSVKKNKVPLRKYWFRFWYDASVGTLDDLWIHRHAEPVLFRASYIQPRRRGVSPELDALVKFYPLDREREYLQTDVERTLPQWVRDEVGRRLPKLLGL